LVFGLRLLDGALAFIERRTSKFCSPMFVRLWARLPCARAASTTPDNTCEAGFFAKGLVSNAPV